MPITLGQVIRKSRLERGMSLRALARDSEIAPQFLSDIERDRRTPGDEVVERIRKALGLATAELDPVDARVPREDLHYFLDLSPELRLAVRDMVRACRAGADLDQLAKRIRKAVQGVGRGKVG